jgi:transglutaminase-like putative cysteine protease
VTGARFPADDGLATRIATLEALDHGSVAWADVRSTAYLIHQHFRYEYDGPIRDLRQRLVIVPPERHGDQRLVTHRLEVSSPTTELRREIDPFGNLVLALSVDHVQRAIDFTAWIVVERDTDHRPTPVSAEVYAGLAFREPSKLTTPDDAIRELAADVRRDADPGAGGFALAAAINQRVYREMRYEHGITGVRTGAGEAWAGRVGVCQDYAHVMLAVCRLLGLPARYVSGHLLGEGGTHAWVEVLGPDAARPGRYEARAFDPTHGCETGLKYVTVATGRDYGDVAPTSGTYVAPHAGSLSSRKVANLTAITYADPS